MTALRRSVLPFDGGQDKTMHAHVRGGKGLSLAEMTALGLRVPPGFTLASGVSRAFNQEGRLPGRIRGQLEREIAQLETDTGCALGGRTHPLIVSVRSGAMESMPGMMDTLLNVGLTKMSLEGLKTEAGDQFARDVQTRFRAQWTGLIGTPVPEDPFLQIQEAVEAVLRSWRSERAVAYRNQHGIAHGMGTAVTVQQMVFGNMDRRSCTGVVFSADPISGEDGLYGEFLVQAQGEDVVSGSARTCPIAELSGWNEAVATELRDIVRKLEAHFEVPVDVEFTVQSGVLYVLQARAVKFSPQGRIVRAVRRVEALRSGNRRDTAKRAVMEEIPPSLVDAVLRPRLAADTAVSDRSIASGISASPGAIVGVVACDIETAKRRAAEGQNVVLVRPDTTPTDLPGMLVSKAIVTGTGGPTCHAAIVARDLGIPAVVGISNPRTLRNGATVTVDGDSGRVFAGALELTSPSPSREVRLFQKWRSRRYVPTVGLRFVAERVSSATLLADLYMTDMMAGVARGTTFEHQAVRLRDEMHESIAERLAMYLLLATAGEARHFWSYASGRDRCEEASAFVDAHLRAQAASRDGYGGRTEMQQQAIRFAESSPEQLSMLVGHLVTLFRRAYWPSEYGGPRWAAIAECLHRFLTRELSPTVFSDQVFDLRHNGGELFDKHPMIEEVPRVKDLLDLKKMDGTVAALKASCDRLRAEMSLPVFRLWQAGSKAGLW